MISFIQGSQERLVERPLCWLLKDIRAGEINQAKKREIPDTAGETGCTNSEICIGISNGGDGYVAGA